MDIPLLFMSLSIMGFPGGASTKGPAYQSKRHKRCIDLWVGKIPWERK